MGLGTRLMLSIPNWHLPTLLTTGNDGYFVRVWVFQKILSIVQSAPTKPLWNFRYFLTGIHHLQRISLNAHTLQTKDNLSTKDIIRHPLILCHAFCSPFLLMHVISAVAVRFDVTLVTRHSTMLVGASEPHLGGRFRVLYP